MEIIANLTTTTTRTATESGIVIIKTILENQIGMGGKYPLRERTTIATDRVKYSLWLETYKDKPVTRAGFMRQAEVQMLKPKLLNKATVSIV